MLPPLASLFLALGSGAATGPDASFCDDISGDWTAGWPADQGGGAPAAPPPGVHWMTVRRAVTPFGTPHAQYVVDHNAALALHRDGRTCLGNGTCSAPQLGFARALNSSSPNCSFIQWPAANNHGGGWCKVPFCPAGERPPPTPPPPPPPAPYPPFNLTWTPTYVMRESTIANPTGNLSGFDTGHTLAMDARFAIISFDGGTMSCLNQRRQPTTGVCNAEGCDKCRRVVHSQPRVGQSAAPPHFVARGAAACCTLSARPPFFYTLGNWGDDLMNVVFRQTGVAAAVRRYAKTFDRAEELARRVKAISPKTHVWSYVNMQLGLSRNQFDCPKLYEEEWSGFWLKDNRTGLKFTVPHTQSQGNCDGTAPQDDYNEFGRPCGTVNGSVTDPACGMAQFYLDWRNASARQWWLDVKLGSLINSPVIDGFYWDDPVFGNEMMSIRDSFSAAECADIDFHMQAVRLEGYKRLSAAGMFCTGSTCWHSMAAPMTCACGPSSANCTCDTSAATVRANLAAAQANGELPSFSFLRYPDRAKTVNVTCAGPAAVQAARVGKGWRPAVLQLSCLPGTGTMTVDARERAVKWKSGRGDFS